MFAIGNEELDKASPIGDSIACPKCGVEHEIKYGEKVLPDGTKIPSKMLAYYKCGGACYLAGVNGKSIMGKGEK